MTIAVELREVSRSFGDVRAVDGVTLSIDDGEFFSMLGPSGSGKTTCLRLIGGFDLPTAGHIFLHGTDASDLPPYERDVNTVFQDYALFPHLSVLDNVAYGLRMRGVGRAARRREAAAALEQVALGGLGGRHPGQLSGGQRQRVALARALVNRPRVLLLDEPLGALDLKLREQMQVELKGLQRRLGITFIYVTHDQGEALSMSDRVAVFNRGRVEQVDRPRDLYMRPRTTFVAGFVGTANVLTGELARRITGTDRPVAIRPERVTFGAPGPGQLSIAGSVIDVQFHGPTSRFEIEAGGARLAVTIANRDGDPDGARPEPGDAVQLAWSPEAMVELRGGDDDDRGARPRLELLYPAEPELPPLPSDMTPAAAATPIESQPAALEPSPTRLQSSEPPEPAATPTDSKPVESSPHDSGPTPVEAVATPTDAKPREPSEPDATRIESKAVEPAGRHDSGLTPIESLAAPIEPPTTPTDAKSIEVSEPDATPIESKAVEPSEPAVEPSDPDATRIESKAVAPAGRHDSGPTPVGTPDPPVRPAPADETP
jgi:putative spermidine/putrescine transport system ATP-binding protein